jgi:hypothetical protein
MKILSPLIGYLGKATAARSNTPEQEDTKPTMPGLINLTLAPPFPTFTTINAPVAGGTPPFVNSVIFAESGTFQTAQSPILFGVGPGVWDFTINHWLEEQGAISDATGLHTLSMIEVTGAGVTPILSRVTNKQGLAQYFTYRFKFTVLAEQQWNFVRTNAAGLGTGLNVGHITIIASRLF